MLLDQIRRLKPSLQQLAAQHGAKRLRVFGSVARGEETPDSDVDFLVQLAPGYDLFSQRISLTQALSGLLQRNVDLVPEHELNPFIRDKVLTEAIDL
ncbi:nucleotidyltransferase family protein [Amphibiibacter pelophylacis]|uniref:Nucleotidyltransferase family protein n=1 Tax=Amphibiibacter pelophylacis TaxID=1799477 RepID=A0ACC6P565_9BURK